MIIATVWLVGNGCTDGLAVPEGWQNHYPGAGCKCAAHDASECGCCVDWNPREIYALRDTLNKVMQCVTTEHESKESFIARVRAILSANGPDQR
jgi:hypothetical protein